MRFIYLFYYRKEKLCKITNLGVFVHPQLLRNGKLAFVQLKTFFFNYYESQFNVFMDFICERVKVIEMELKKITIVQNFQDKIACLYNSSLPSHAAYFVLAPALPIFSADTNTSFAFKYQGWR